MSDNQLYGKYEDMDSKEIERLENIHKLNLRDAMGLVFKASTEYYDLKSFTYLFLQSKTFTDFFTDWTLFSQSPFYILEVYTDELKEKGLDINKEITPHQYREEDIAYWFGYMFAAWNEKYDFHGLSKHHIEWLWNGFTTLHMESVEGVYELYEQSLYSKLSEEKADFEKA